MAKESKKKGERREHKQPWQEWCAALWMRRASCGRSVRVGMVRMVSQIRETSCVLRVYTCAVREESYFPSSLSSPSPPSSPWNQKVK